jgi:hypothetical protein
VIITARQSSREAGRYRAGGAGVGEVAVTGAYGVDIGGLEAAGGVDAGGVSVTRVSAGVEGPGVEAPGGWEAPGGAEAPGGRGAPGVASGEVGGSVVGASVSVVA